MNRDPSNTMPDPNRQKDDRLKVIAGLLEQSLTLAEIGRRAAFRR